LKRSRTTWTEVLEDFRQVAAGLALDEHGGGGRSARRAAEIRTVRLVSESFSGRPKFCSSNAFRNSGPIGSDISSPPS
jgi:hypothetical protein